MNKDEYHKLIETPVHLDYSVYLKVDDLLQCQSPLADLCNGDELMFQIVHQVEELWMKLMAYSLVDVIDYMKQGNTLRILTLMKRVGQLQRLMITQLDVLETMSPHEYQEIRTRLGNGSGQESPGFRILLKLPADLWVGFENTYLTGRGLSVTDIYHHQYDHGESYAVAEALVEFDELFQKFRSHHLFLINRSIGIDATSLKGRSVHMLKAGTSHQFFPELWQIRTQMTDEWGGEYGTVRESIAK